MPVCCSTKRVPGISYRKCFSMSGNIAPDCILPPDSKATSSTSAIRGCSTQSDAAKSSKSRTPLSTSNCGRMPPGSNVTMITSCADLQQTVAGTHPHPGGRTARKTPGGIPSLAAARHEQRRNIRTARHPAPNGRRTPLPRSAFPAGAHSQKGIAPAHEPVSATLKHPSEKIFQKKGMGLRKFRGSIV